MHKITWYPFFNNQQKNEELVLIKNETIYPENILIAKKTSTSWQYTKFGSIQKFMTYYTKCNIENKTFYSVLTNKTRYLYLDIDYKLETKLLIKDHKLLISTIKHHLNKFVVIYGRQFGIKHKQCNWIIWDGSRLHCSQKYFVHKFSLHIVDIGNMMHYLDIKLFAETFSFWLNNNNILSINCIIDNNIYHDGYQPWRLPYNHNGDKKSLLRLYENKMSLIEQFTINIMNKIGNIKLVHLTKNKNLNNKISDRIHNKTTHSNHYSDITNYHLSIKNKPFKIPNIPKIYFYPNLQNPEKKICNKIRNIFQISMPNKISNYEYILTQHYCPIIKKKHRRNSARLLLLHIPNTIDSEHCIYTCMDQDCRMIMKQQFINLTTTTFKRPWLIYNLHHLDEQILMEIDTFIDLLISTNILSYNNNQQSIIKANKIKFNYSNIIFSTFIHDTVMHNKCKCNNMSLSYRSATHKYVKYGKITLYCRHCKTFINMKDNQLIYN